MTTTTERRPTPACPCSVRKDERYVIESHDRLIRALEDPETLELLDVVATSLMDEGPIESADILLFGVEHAWSHPGEVGTLLSRLDELGRAYRRAALDGRTPLSY